MSSMVGCHDVLIIPVNLKDINYHCIMKKIGKREVVILRHNSDLSKKSILL